MNKIIFIIFSLYICLYTPVNAETLFSDDFEWGEDWNSGMATTLLTSNGWAGKLSTNYGGSLDVIYISTAQAKNGSRGMIQYWDTRDPEGAAQDAWLITRPTLPNEWYMGYWYKVDSNWDWGSSGRLKIMKLKFSPETGDTWDAGYWTTWYSSLSGETGEYPESGCDLLIATGGEGLNAFGCWTDLEDGEWHSFIWRFNHSSGIISLEIDGVDAAMTSNSTNFGGTAWDSSYGVSFGGNISGTGAGYSEMYTAYDDFIIATTKAEVEEFLDIDGNSNTGTITSGTTWQMGAGTTGSME